MFDTEPTPLDKLTDLPARTQRRRVGSIMVAGPDEIGQLILEHVFDQKQHWSFAEVVTITRSLCEERGTLEDWIEAERLTQGRNLN